MQREGSGAQRTTRDIGIGLGAGLLAGLAGAAQWVLTARDLDARWAAFQEFMRAHPGLTGVNPSDRTTEQRCLSRGRPCRGFARSMVIIIQERGILRNCSCSAWSMSQNDRYLSAPGSHDAKNQASHSPSGVTTCGLSR